MAGREYVKQSEVAGSRWLVRRNVDALGNVTYEDGPVQIAVLQDIRSAIQSLAAQAASTNILLETIARQTSPILASVRESVAAMTDEQKSSLSMPISSLGLSFRANKGVARVAMTIGDLICLNSDDLMEIRNFGMSSLWEVREALGKRGLALAGEFPMVKS